MTVLSSGSQLRKILPLVSVAVLAYNHERFIEQAIRSVLAQETAFSIEILVGEDCSTDRTREILIRLDREYPKRLILLLRDRNVGLSANLQDCRERARGKYLAVLEGDDYWIDPQKLQKQCDAMEANLNWSMCYASCRIFYEDGSKKDRIHPIPPPVRPLVVDDLLQESKVQTMSVAMYRQNIVARMPPWHASLRLGDWALHILHADVGPIGFLPDVVTAYRVHRRGLWSGLDTFRQWEEMLRLFQNLEQHFGGQRAQEMKGARDRLIAHFSERVADLEKVERRYLLLRLDKFAATYRRIRETFSSPKTP